MSTYNSPKPRPRLYIDPELESTQTGRKSAQMSAKRAQADATSIGDRRGLSIIESPLHFLCWYPADRRLLMLKTSCHRNRFSKGWRPFRACLCGTGLHYDST